MSALFECRARRGDLGGYNQLITIGLVSPGVGPHRPAELSSLGIRRLRRGEWRAARVGEGLIIEQRYAQYGGVRLVSMRIPIGWQGFLARMLCANGEILRIVLGW